MIGCGIWLCFIFMCGFGIRTLMEILGSRRCSSGFNILDLYELVAVDVASGFNANVICEMVAVGNHPGMKTIRGMRIG